MKKNLLLLFALLSCYSTIIAQNVPQTFFIGAVKINISDNAKEKIQKEMAGSLKNQNYVDKIVGKMYTHLPIVERILAEENVPDELKYICVIESMLDANAVSKSNAVGFWQLKKETAQGLYLRVDGVIDERKHLIASTKAASAYFKDHNEKLNSWPACMLAYRWGLTTFKQSDLAEWASKSEITLTGDNKDEDYVIRFIAYRTALDNRYRQIKQEKPDSVPSLLEYNQTKGRNLSDIASELKVSVKDIEQHNAWLSSRSIPDDKDYTLFVPVGGKASAAVIAMNTQQPKPVAVKGPSTGEDGFPVLVKKTDKVTSVDEPVYYEINGKKGILSIDGDTPARIAERADISLKRFLKFNDLDESDRIIPNQVYYLKKKERKGPISFHTVQANQSLWWISQMYGMTLESLMEKNQIENPVQKLPKGKILWLIDERPLDYKDEIKATPEPEQPKKAPVETPKPVAKPVEPVATEPSDDNKPNKSLNDKYLTQRKIVLHNVQSTDTYYTIAEKYGMSVEELMQMNGIFVTDPLKPGQVLRVYAEGETKPSTTTDKNTGVGANTPVLTPAEPKPVAELPKTTPEKVVEKPVAEKPVTKAPDTRPSPSVSNTGDIVNPLNRVVHTVQRGETLSKIARYYQVSIDNLKSWNGLALEDVEVSQEISIYGLDIRPKGGAASSTPTPPANNTPTVSTDKNGRVKDLLNIDTPEKDKKTTDTSTVKPTEKPKPVATTSPTTLPVGTTPDGYHVVQPGETAYRISVNHGITVQKLLELNGLSSPTIKVGSKLKIK